MDVLPIATALPPLLIVPAMGILSRIRGGNALARELRRKALHIAVGLASLAFPYLLRELWMVLAALSILVSWLLAVRVVPTLRRRFGAVLHDAQRISYGELYFALAIAVLLLTASRNPLLFVVPVLILTVSDAAAAVVGNAFARGALSGPASGKTMSGCLAFAATAFPIALLGLIHYTSMPIGVSVHVAAFIAAATCVVEAISQRGRDNFFVPMTAYVLLNALL